jgi:hypothetical protein
MSNDCPSLNIYTAPSNGTAPPSPPPNQLPTGWANEGCVVDVATHILQGFSFTSSIMTPELCASTCAARSFNISGAESAAECYCGNAFVGGTPANASTSDCECRALERVVSFDQKAQATAHAPETATWLAVVPTGALTLFEPAPLLALILVPKSEHFLCSFEHFNVDTAADISGVRCRTLPRELDLARSGHAAQLCHRALRAVE